MGKSIDEIFQELHFNGKETEGEIISPSPFSENKELSIDELLLRNQQAQNRNSLSGFRVKGIAQSQIDYEETSSLNPDGEISTIKETKFTADRYVITPELIPELRLCRNCHSVVTSQSVVICANNGKEPHECCTCCSDEIESKRLCKKHQHKTIFKNLKEILKQK